jgi:hypothetical protein|nr:hypothetical protein [Candidatus Krumholzibacteria bacterium]
MAADSRGGLEDTPFSCRQGGDGKVSISWRGRQVLVLKGRKAQSFLLKLPDLDTAGQQLLMARETGNFKRGNER